MGSPPSARMAIGEVAARAGLPVKTVRYYEEIGLVRPARAANGYRAFSEEDARRLAFVARARGLGFAVTDCRALLSLWEDRGRASADVKALAARHLAEVERKIAELEALRASLGELVARCEGDARPDCPILDGLAGEGGETGGACRRAAGGV